MLLYLFFETRFAVYLSNMRWNEVPCNNGSTILRFFICSGFGDCEKTPGGVSGGVSVCVRAVCKFTMQTIWDFQQHFL